MSQAAILALFTTLSQEERLETVQSLCALLQAGAAPSGAAGKKTVKASESALAGLVRATQRSAKVSAAPAKEKVSRPPSDWTQYVSRVRAETGLKQPDAMKEASRRREAGDPSCPLPPVAEKKAAAPKKAKASPAPAPASAEEEEEESPSTELEEVEVEGQDYWYLPAHENAAWLKEADGSRGAWAGYLNTETGEFDLSRPAPEFEEADE